MKWIRVLALAVTAALAGGGLAVRPAGAGEAPSFSIDSVTIQEQNGGVGSLRFTVALTGAHPSGAGVQYQTSPVTATEGAGSSSCNTTRDYIETFGAVSMLSAETTAFVDVNICSDTFDEPDETFNVTLFSPTGGSVIGTGVGVGTILDNDAVPTLTVNSTSVTEGNAGTNQRTIPVSLSTASGRTVTFNYATQPTGTATAAATCGGAADYATSSGSITIPAGATTPSTALTLPICGDTVDEPNQTFGLRISNVVNANGPSSDRTITITDDDATSATVSVNNVSRSESNATLTFTVSLSTTAGSAVGVNYATAAQTATAGTSCTTGVDYVTRTGNVSIPAGSTSGSVAITLCNDALDENSETFALNLTSATGAAGISDNQGIGTITDNDPTPVLAVSSARTVVEGNTGIRNLQVVWTLTTDGSLQASGRTITFRIATANGTAIAGTCGTSGVDYESVDRTVTINPGSRVGVVNIRVCGDTVVEAGETLTWTVTNIVNATPSSTTGTGTGTIRNDDGAAITITDRSVTEGNGNSQLSTSLTVNFASPAPAAGTLSFTLGGTAVGASGTLCGAAPNGTDYLRRTTSPVSFAAGATSVSVNFFVCRDTQFELNDTIEVSLVTADWFSISDSLGVLTIVNDDPLPG